MTRHIALMLLLGVAVSVSSCRNKAKGLQRRNQN